MLKTIVFFGTDKFSAASLRKLIAESLKSKANFRIGAVVTKPDTAKGRGHKISKPIVKEIAEENNIEVWQPLNNAELSEQIIKLSKDINEKPIGVLVSYGRIVPQSIINMFEPGIINVHPSLLPKYRGPSPIESAIINGDSETGVSIMKLTKAMDAGPVYSQINRILNGDETTPDLEEELSQSGADELARVLPEIISGSLTAKPQDDTQATYCHLLDKKDSLLNPAKLTAEQAERKIRAYLNFPRSKIEINNNLIIVIKAKVTEIQESNHLDIKFRDGKFLHIEELVSPSGKTMSRNAYINGYLR